MEKILIKGNEAIGLAAIKAGCKAFFGYPITPQNELPEYMSRELSKNGGVFIQAESEIAAINMVYGAAGCGARVMTSSSSPGIALKQEGISYIVGAELPCVIVNVMRGGPGLGGIQPSQADYFQGTRGGGHGDYYMPVYTPATVQETFDLVIKGFQVADRYRTPVLILVDGIIGQIMEAIEIKDSYPQKDIIKEWATKGTNGERKPNIINSLFLNPEKLEEHNNRLFEKYEIIKREEELSETLYLEDSEIVLVAYGTTSRIVKQAIEDLRDEGIKVGLVRPITAWPFPYSKIQNLNTNVNSILVVEMSKGQMVQDILLGNKNQKNIFFLGRTGGMVPSIEEVKGKVKEILRGEANEYSI